MNSKEQWSEHILVVLLCPNYKQDIVISDDVWICEILFLMKLHLRQNYIKSLQGVASANNENNIHIVKGQELQIKEINDSLVVGEDFHNSIGILENMHKI